MQMVNVGEIRDRLSEAAPRTLTRTTVISQRAKRYSVFTLQARSVGGAVLGPVYGRSTINLLLAGEGLVGTVNIIRSKFQELN